MSSGRIQLGQLLLRSHLITGTQLQTALAEQQRWGGKLGEILVRMAYLSEERLVEALSRQLGVAVVDLDKIVERIPAAVAARVPRATARRCHVVPVAVGRDGKSLAVAMADPGDLRSLDELRAVTGGTRIVPYLAGPKAIARALDRLYREEEALGEPGGELALVDAQGRVALQTGAGPVPANGTQAAAAATPANGLALPAPAGGTAPAPSPQAAPGRGAEVDLAALVRRLEARQGTQSQLFVALIDLLVEKGVLSREEILARVRR